MICDVEQILVDQPDMFENFLNDAKKPLYGGCSKFSKITAVLKLYNLKVGNGWSDKSFSALLGLLKEILPVDNCLSSSTYEAKKLLCSVGMDYQKIHACPNDCILYRKEYELLERCPNPECGEDYLAVGAILSATDSVCTLQVLNQDETPFLYSVVFGEGVVNDATSIVLFNAVQSIDFSNVNGMTALSLILTFLYLFFTSTILGIVVGLLSAYIIKKLYIGRHSTDREIAIMLLMAYLSYMIAELMSLSGILTVFFCGVIMSHYTWHNITESSRITTKHAFPTMSFIAETFIFLYVGTDALDISQWKASSASSYRMKYAKQGRKTPRKKTLWHTIKCPGKNI